MIYLDLTLTQVKAFLTATFQIQIYYKTFLIATFQIQIYYKNEFSRQNLQWYKLGLAV